MGEDARWVCNTCKTVCYRGGRPIFQGIPAYMSLHGIRQHKEQITSFSSTFVLDDKDSMIGFLDDLQRWLSRHEGHNIHIGSDYSTDMWDLDDYHSETVDGKISKLSNMDVRMSVVDAIAESSIRDIQKTLEEYADNRDELSSRKIAEELYQKFSMEGFV